MSPKITCANCGAYYPLPDPTTGIAPRCPSCFVPFQAPAQPAVAAAPTSVPAVPTASPNKTVLAESEPMIRYGCPKCRKALESPASFAGTKLNCPGCNQRLQIPLPPPPPAAPAAPVNKTILALGEPSAASMPQALPPAPQQPPVEAAPFEVEVVDEPAPVVKQAPPPARESCLECGVDVTKRSRVQTCPDCGSQFCSAQCYREHRYHAHDKRKKKRRRNADRDAECDYCGSTARPYITSQISEGGWATFIILLIFFFPLCWIGLLMTETRVKCSDCGARLS